MKSLELESKIKNLIIESIRNIYSILDSSDIIHANLEIPKEKAFGDLATNVALRLSNKVRQPALEIANLIADTMRLKLEDSILKDKIDSIEVKPPGFINIFLTKEHLWDVLNKILKEKSKFGRSDIGKNKPVLVEFVSANPTGPLSIAHARQAAFGDSLANILKFCGYKVSREYLINDEGNQIDMLGKSIHCRYLEISGKSTDFVQDGYKGKYIYEIAQALVDRYKDKYVKPNEKTIALFSNFGSNFIMKEIKKDLKDFGVKFNTWYSQKSLIPYKRIEKTFGYLKTKGYLYKKDGATWFKSTCFSDDKDRVLVKKDGTLTYVAADITYHQDKYKRGFERLINIWGPDHHGYILRMIAAIEALGFAKESIDIIIIQLATLYKEGKPIRMSTRAGEFVTLREVLDEVGKDAARFFFLMRKSSSHLDFDLELAKKQSLENPVYYIQYAHARISSILEYSKTKDTTKKKVDLSLLNTMEEMEILKTLHRFPQVILSIEKSLEPFALVVYLQELASVFHSFYNKHRVVTDDARITEARLVLVDAVGQVIKTGLDLLGIYSPKSM